MSKYKKSQKFKNTFDIEFRSFKIDNETFSVILNHCVHIRHNARRHDGKHDDFTRQKKGSNANAITSPWPRIIIRQTDRQTARFESLYSYDKCPTVHPFKDGLLDLDVSYWISSSALIHQGLLYSTFWNPIWVQH